ncbi:MAG: transglutaminase-like domain-containing protein [Chloroflexi bacterium]|nr:transglutaminase-like domain-containing protein [Chloroflexota bacterium]
MTARPIEQRATVDLGAWARRIAAGPAEGWSSLVLLLVMGLTMAWSIDDARWVLGRDENLDFLAWMIPPAILLGFALAKSPWSRFACLVIGCCVGVVVVGVAVGMTVDETAPVPFEALGAAVASATRAYTDLVIRARATTTQIGHFLAILGLLVWATAFFASWVVYRHGRPLSAVMAVGFVLVANMSITIRDQFYLLVIFSLAALLLLVRVRVSEEQRAWSRHRIDDATRTASIFLRAGLAFVSIAVVGSLVLTTTAASAPLAAAWDGVDQRIVEVGATITRLLPGGGPGTRVGGIVFGQSAAITGTWVTDDTLVFTAKVPTEEDFAWRAAAYDEFNGGGWTWTDTRDRRLQADAPLFGETGDALDPATGRREIVVEVTPSESAPRLIVSPNGPATIDRSARVTLVYAAVDATPPAEPTVAPGATPGEALPLDGFFATVTAPDAPRPYTVKALVPDVDPADPSGLTANRLRAAGQAYPGPVLALYTGLLPGTVGTETRLLLERIEEESGAENPYDLARAVERFLRDPANFTYDTDVSDVECGGRGVTDCFVVSRRGYCEYYATTMAVMLRLRGIPTRFVEGFLPGDRTRTGEQTVRRDRAHAWVEVYFPGYGWVDFDPTGGGVGLDTSLPAGPPVATPTPTPRPSGSFGVDDERDPRQTAPAGGSAPLQGGSGPGIPGPLAAVLAALVVAAVVLLGVAVLLRRPPRPVGPDAAYGTITRIAGRLGYGQRPEQTVYEYTAALGDVLPSVRPELTLVATSKVEATYARREPGPDLMRQLALVRRRLRVRLLALVFRRPRVRRRGGTPGGAA